MVSGRRRDVDRRDRRPRVERRFVWNPRARSTTSFTGADDGSPGGLWTATPAYHWEQNPAGSAAAYVTAPLAANTVVIGGGAVQLWMESAAPSVDLQVTVSEVRPDGRETFVQNGWLRVSERKLDSGRARCWSRCSASAAATWRRCPVAATPR